MGIVGIPLLEEVELPLLIDMDLMEGPNEGAVESLRLWETGGIGGGMGGGGGK